MTSTEDPVVVLMVTTDDRDSLLASSIGIHGISAYAVEPQNIDLALLDRADVVMINQHLTGWPAPDYESLHASDCLSLAAALRASLARRRSRNRIVDTTAFAIHSRRFSDFGEYLPHGMREHLLAERRDVDWVFDAGTQPAASPEELGSRIAQLACAVAALPGDAATFDKNFESQWLGLQGPWAWCGEALRQITECQPPRGSHFAGSPGQAWLRWFIHRILPYPTFLLDDRRAAAVLRIQEESLCEVMDSNSPLTYRLSEFVYSGSCATFCGRRWWRAGLSEFLVETFDDADPLTTFGPHDVVDFLARVHGSELEPITVRRPVLRVNADHETLRGPISISEGIQLQLEGWPAFADDAWASEADLVDERIRALVLRTDRWRRTSS